MGPETADTEREAPLVRARSEAGDGEVTELAACEVCGLLQRRPASLVCPSCGAGHG